MDLDRNCDKTPVLRQYGMANLGDNAPAFGHWGVCCHNPDDLKELDQTFGLEEDNQVTHTMQTTSRQRQQGRPSVEGPEGQRVELER